MSDRHERRKARAISRKKLAKLKTATLDQHFDNTLRRVRTEFERTGEVAPVFECMTDNEIFHVSANWPDRRAKAAAWTALRDSFRRRGVNRYDSPPKLGWAKLRACARPMIPLAVSAFW
jgi:hypothetical protein